MAADRDAWNSLPKSERARRRAASKAEKDAKRAKKEAKAAEKDAKRAEKEAKRNGHPPPSSLQPPDTVRSERLAGATIPSPPPPPPLEITRRGAGDLRGLLDLVGALPELGHGTCFIQVTRVKPTTAFGQNCAGVQRAIWEPIDDGEFLSMYGGAEYQLRGYAYREDGRPKALTEVITYKVAGPPNLDSLPNAEEEPEMQPNRPMRPVQNGAPLRRFPVSPQAASAEAEMHDRDLTHQETMDERKERRRREQEAAEREQRRAEHNVELERERLAAQARDKEMERLAAAHERQLEMARGGGVGEMAELLKVMRPGEETAALIRQHAADTRAAAERHQQEVARLVESQREEVRRLIEQHQVVITRLEDQNRSDRDRSDTAIREAERRSNDIAREAQSTADRRVNDAQNAARAQYEDLKTRSEERLRDQNEQWQRRFEDLKESHSREIRQKESEITMMRSNLEGNQQIILGTKDAEIKRLMHEVRVAKDEAEKNKDWHGKIKEFEDQAEAMGWSKGGGDGDEEGGDTKTILIKAGMQALSQLPQMIQAGANAVAQIRAPAAAPSRGEVPRQQMRPNPGGCMRTIPQRHAPQLQAPMTFSTEGGANYTPPSGTAPPFQPEMPAMQFHETMAPPPVVAEQPAPQQQQFAPDPVPQLQAPIAAPAPAAVAPSPGPAPAPQQPSPSVAPPSMPPPSAGVPELDPQAAAIVPDLCKMLTLNFNEKVPPELVADALAKEYGVDMLRVAIGMVSQEQLAAFVNANSGQFKELASRTGQKYVSTLLKKVHQILGAQ